MTIHSFIYGGGERSKISFSQYSAGQNYWGLELKSDIPIQGVTSNNMINGYCTCCLESFTILDGNYRKSYEVIYFYSCDNTDFSNWLMLGITTWNRTNYQKTYQLKKLVQAQNPRESEASLGYTVPSDGSNIYLYVFGGRGASQAVISSCDVYILNLNLQTAQYSKTISFTNTENAVNFQGILHPMQKTYVFYGGVYDTETSTSKKKTSANFYLLSQDTCTVVKDSYQYGYYHLTHGSGIFIIKGLSTLFVFGGFDPSEKMKNYCFALFFNDQGKYSSNSSSVYTYISQGTKRENMYILTGNILQTENCSAILLHGFYSNEQKDFSNIPYSIQSYRMVVDEYHKEVYCYPISIPKRTIISNLQWSSYYPRQYLGYGGMIISESLKFNQNIENPNTRYWLYDSSGESYAYSPEIFTLQRYPLLGEQYLFYNPIQQNFSIQYESIAMIPITKNSTYLEQSVKVSTENTVLRPNTIPYTGYVDFESDTITGSYLNDGTKEVDSKIQLLP